MESRDKEQTSPNESDPSKKVQEGDEIKNAHATGIGAMGRSDEALPDKPEENTKG